MLTQGRFLISYQIFDNIQVNNIGQTHVREILKDTQAFTFSYNPIYLLLQCHQEMGIQSQENRNPSST